jgi:hypothetical protein
VAIPRFRPHNRGTPAYSITKLDGDYEQVVAFMTPLSDKKDKNGNQKYKMEMGKIKKPRGYLVETPMTRGGYHRNGTFHVDTIEKLKELGFDLDEVPLVDPEMDGPIGTAPLKLKKQEKVNA